jgi:putative ABC transport system substrate-binding protein
MDRRAFLVVSTVASGCGPSDVPKTTTEANRVTPTSADAPGVKKQLASTRPQAKIPRVAMLVFGSRLNGSATANGTAPVATLVRDRLTELGYVEGQTILLEERYADGDPKRLTQLANEIVQSKPDAIVAIAAAATAAARQATSTIPIVMVHAGDPVGSGLATTLAHPGGNVTGTTSMVPDLGVKQVELLRQLVPGLARLGVLANPTNAGVPPSLANVNEAARRFSISVVVAEVTRAEDFDQALGLLRDARLDALLVLIEPMIFMNCARVLDFAAANRLPASYDVGRVVVRQGGLVSYGPVLTTHYALAADYVDKILKGARPGDLPIQQPIQFALAINLKTAREIGVTIPQPLLLRADELIQ